MIEVARLDNETLQPTGETNIHPQQSVVEFVGRMSRMGYEQQLLREADGWQVYRFILGSGGRNPLPKDRWQISHRAIRELNGREPAVPPASVTETLKIIDAKLLDEPAEPVTELDTSVEPYELPEAPAAVTEAPATVPEQPRPRRRPLPNEWTPEARIHVAERFLSVLMAPYGQAPGLTCEIRSSDPAAPEAGWTSKPFGLAPAFLRRAAEYAVEISADQNVYVGVLPRMGRSGSARSVTRAAWLWVELDLADGTPEQLRALIRKAGALATPRMFVQSGSGGGHLYYPLDVVCELPGDDDRERYSDVLRGLVEAINEVAPFGGASVHVDYRDEKGKRAAANITGAHADPACVDVARILRIPGTLNHKSDPPRPVKMFWAEKEPHSAEWWKGRLPFRSLPLGAEPRAESPGDAAGNERVDPAQTGGVVANANGAGRETHGYALDGDVCVGNGGPASGPGPGAAPGEGAPLPTADEPAGAGADRGNGSAQVLLSSGHPASTYQAEILRFQELGDGHGLVTAVAGSGKTTTLVEMSKRRGMHERGRALFVAFNKHIADELATRLPSGVEARTIHSMGYRCLANVVEPPAKETWINANKYRVLSRAYVKQEGMNSFKRRDLVDALDQAVSFTMYTLSPVGDVDALQGIVDHYGLDLPQDYPIERLADGVRTLIAWGRDGSPDGEFAGLRQSVSYDELVYYPATMEIRLPYYQTLYVDESQDLNAMQREFVLRLLDPSRGRAMFVGDPQQAIYGFSGADTGSIERIAERTNPRRLPLSICYRCPRTHVQLAQEIVPEIESAPGAPDGELVVEKASHLRGLVVAGDLVLCRTTAPLVNACFDLIRAGTPAQVRGRDIGRNLARTVETIENGTLNARFDMFLGLLDSYTDVQLRMLLQREDNELAVEALMDRTATLRVLYERAYGDDGVREWSRFRAYIEAMFGDEGGNLVTLSTVHRAKGLEADHVLLLRPELMPHPKAKRAWELSQERNLKYVALTRSKRRLTILETDEAA